MQLTNHDRTYAAQGPADIERAIDALDGERSPFLVLGREDQVYVQTAFEGERWGVEKRDGAPDRHYRAEPISGGTDFSKDEVKRIFIAWFERRPDPSFMRWELMPTISSRMGVIFITVLILGIGLAFGAAHFFGGLAR